MQDADEFYPVHYNNAGNWGQFIYPYIKATAVFTCPSNPLHVPWVCCVNTIMGHGVAAPAPQIPYSYGTNDWLFDQKAPHNANDIASPAGKIMVGEVLDNYGEFDMAAPDWWGTDIWRGNIFAGHGGLSNYLFVDGHVKAMTPQATETNVNMWGYFCDLTINTTNCTAQDINCDLPSPTAQTRLIAQWNKFQ